MAKDSKLPQQPGSTSSEVDDFLRKLAAAPAAGPGASGQAKGRLIFALDATASREPTWDRASHLQAEMFKETEALGGLEVQLIYYRGFGECKASPWVAESAKLLRFMTGVFCLAGRTQIGKVLKRAAKETRQRKVAALVFVGDAMEEDIDHLGHLAGELGLLGVPCFMFHEGNDPVSRRAFQQIARLSGGAFCNFDSASAKQLRELLSAVAVFAAGGRRALADYSARTGGLVPQLTHQVK
jgi:hypothetical protein